MSADSWQKCPKCYAKHKAKLAKKKSKVEASYGKVTPEEYMRGLEEIKKEEYEEFPSHFREDYSHGMCTDGRYVVDYSGSCDSCGFSHQFKHIEQLTIT